jgi:hypothetical protein
MNNPAHPNGRWRDVLRNARELRRTSARRGPDTSAGTPFLDDAVCAAQRSKPPRTTDARAGD